MNPASDAGIRPQPKPAAYHRSEFTKEMYQSGYTILAPQMSPIHFDLLEPIFKKYGYHIEVLANDNRAAIDMGLKFVNNDACFPSITVVGQIMDAVLSGKYDTDKLAVMMTQTGGCCRASNYVGFIRRALDKAGLGHIPVISLNANGMETNEGFKLSPGLLFTALRGVVYGDLFMRCLYRVRPYEKEKGSANALHRKWLEIAIDSLVNSKSKWSYKAVCSGIVEAFDALPIDETLRKPRVGVVGEILVKYMPLANNHLVDLLEAEGAEAVVPDLMDFLNYCVYNGDYKHEFLGAGWTSAATAKLGVDAIRLIRKPALDALEKSRRFEPPMPIEKVAELAKPFLSIGNQYGEGWFLTGEMAELVLSGTPNIVCIQPFACLPNHVVGKGVIKALKKAYPQSNLYRGLRPRRVGGQSAQPHQADAVHREKASGRGRNRRSISLRQDTDWCPAFCLFKRNIVIRLTHPFALIVQFAAVVEAHACDLFRVENYVEGVLNARVRVAVSIP